MPRTQLARGARGLPRYYMDVGWYRAPAFAGLEPADLFLFEACVGYCTEHATDGRMPAHHEDLAAALGLRASHIRKPLQKLLERELLVHAGPGFIQMPDWAEHNPTAAEISARSSERADAGGLGNHTRWHTNRGIVDPTCPHCTPPNSDRSSDPTSDSDGLATESHGIALHGNAAAESNSDSPSDSTPPDPAAIHLDAHIAWRGRAIKNPAGYRRAQLGDIRIAAAAGEPLEDRWPTRHPTSNTTPTPAHIPGTGTLTRHTDPRPDHDFDTTDRGAPIVRPA